MNPAVSPLHTEASTAAMREFSADELFFSITDERGVIQHANSVFTRLSGYEFADMRGRPHNIVRDPAMPRGAFQLVWEELQAGRPVASYVANLASSGERYEVFAVMLPTEHGIISIRLRPETDGLRDTVFEIFDRAREVEARVEGGGPSKAAAGAASIRSELHTLGIASFTELTHRTLPREVAATIESIAELEYSAGTTPLEILPGKVRMVGRLLLGPLRSLDAVDPVCAALTAATAAEQQLTESIARLAEAVQESSETLAWSGTDVAGAGLELGDLATRSAESIRQAQHSYRQAASQAASLREHLDSLSQHIALLALQNQMIGRFAVELIGGAVAEPPGTSMRLLHHALSSQFSDLTRGIAEVNRLSEESPSTLARARRDLELALRPLQHWCEAAERVIQRQGSAAVELSERVRAVRSGIQQALELSREVSAKPALAEGTNVHLDELPLQATITFIGRVVAEIE